MTFSDEYVTNGEKEPVEEPPSYPSAFGITFTPQVSGLAFAVVGLLGALYVLTSFVLPAYQQYQQLKTDANGKEDQINLQKSGVLEKKLQETELKLKQAQRQKTDVLNLFSNEDTLDTLLLDINGFVTAKKAKLINYKPVGNEISVVNDGSLGAQVNNKLKRQTIELEMQGTFEQTQSVIRDIERLQPLMLVKNLNSEMNQRAMIVLPDPKTGNAQIVNLPATIKTKVTLDVVLPLSQEEVAKLAPSPEEQQKKEEEKKS
jgi:hypothetical protein